MRKYNKGEWSEIYAFTYLLASGVLYAADENANRIDTVFFPVIKIIREEELGRPIDYKTGEIIRIYDGTSLLREVDRDEFESISEELLRHIAVGERAFEIPSVDEFFDNIYCNKVKAASNQKQDITIQLHDVNTGITPVCGFSIKSYIGANPTLINPGRNTNFTYTVEGCSNEIMEETNAIESRTKLIDRMDNLVRHRCSFVPQVNSISKQFYENLQFIDTNMPTLLSYAVLYCYRYGIRDCSDIIKKLKEMNPLGFSNPEMYAYKFKKLLCAWALGLTPERDDWLGSEDANGGYIIVKRDGEVVCYHLYNRTEFENYLFNYSYFDKPSASRYDYMSVYKEDDEYCIKLCLQVRSK